jgi:thiol-disulfide isomerase/thioredoxin
MRQKFTTIAAAVPATLALCTLLIGCSNESGPITSQSTNYEVGDDTPIPTPSESASSASVGDMAAATNGQSPPERPQPINQAGDSASVSDDMVQPTPEQLLDVIRRMAQQEPKGTGEDEVVANFINIQQQLVQAADMLLKMKPTDEQAVEAATAKIQALTTVARLGAEGAIEQVFAFTEELEKSPNEKISAFGRQQSFLTLLNAYSTDQVTDTQQVVDGFKTLAAEQPKEGGVLTFGRDVASRLIEKGANKEAAELLYFTAGLVKGTEDPQLKGFAESLLEQAKFAEVDLGAKISAVAEREEGAVEEFAKTLAELTSGEAVGATTLQTLMQLAGQLEASYGDAAAKVYDALEASLGKLSDEDHAEMIRDSIDKYRRRSSIVGKPFDLQGVTIDEAPFDWSKYKGKIVLVDFWATWCGPCLQEMPNIRANYEKYHEHGFEVVGVNLDDDVEKLKEFNSLQPLPWPSVLSDTTDAVGWEHPMVAKYGVAGIPFLVLVDREGIAIALNTRGPALGEKLAELFPEASSENETPAATDSKPATEPKAAGATPEKAETDPPTPPAE